MSIAHNWWNLYSLECLLHVVVCVAVVNAMKYHKDCWPFLHAVTEEDAPGYSDVIKVSPQTGGLWWVGMLVIKLSPQIGGCDG